jgi:hypothetical protein
MQHDLQHTSCSCGVAVRAAACAVNVTQRSADHVHSAELNLVAGLPCALLLRLRAAHE